MKNLLIILVIVFIVLQYRLWVTDNGMLDAFGLKREIGTQRIKNQELIENNKVLTDEIAVLQDSKAAIENRARNDLGMIKKGEVFYQVTE